MELEAFKFPGFHISEEVYRTLRSVVFRALREKDNSRVILKTVPPALVSPATRARLHREYDVTKDLQVSCFRRSIAPL